MDGFPVPTPKNVDDFRKLYLRKYGVGLRFDEAQEAMASLMRFVYLADECLRREGHDGTEE